MERDGYCQGISGSYPGRPREQEGEVFQSTVQVADIKRLLAEIRKETVYLRTLFLTKEELKEISEVSASFDDKMQEAIYSTIKNLEEYQQTAWKELIHKRGRSDG